MTPKHDKFFTTLGVCYYPEHWPEEEWPKHCQKMRDAGIEAVRVAEFSWSRIEPSRECFDFAWLDRAIDIISSFDLSLILCTPTATPPKWLIDEAPEEILATSADGTPRRFGSRRHYCFSSERYLTEALRISEVVVKRYANHPAVIGWQTDNEYGCHETTISYSAHAQKAFRGWLQKKYVTISALNKAWGTVFWSQEYQCFKQIDAPVHTVTEANPSHRLDYQRFSSDQVIRFNRAQTNLIRQYVHSDVWLTHNAMGNSLEYDHYHLGKDLDIVTWDEYPLGFLQQAWFSNKEKQTYRRIGHPDWAAFHHDLYRATGKGRFGVIELQPGAVNWADYNAQPIAGAPKFWGMEAAAHGAELISYFRWQQPTFAQEQMHMALNYPNGDPTPTYFEVQQLAKELKNLDLSQKQSAEVALVFDYASCWSIDNQPQADSYNALQVAMSYYSALRKLGLNIDILPPNSDVNKYKLVVIPAAIFPMPDTAKTLGENACLVLGPRSGSKTNNHHLPIDFGPAHWQRLIPLQVVTVDSIRPDTTIDIEIENSTHRYEAHTWIEQIDSQLIPLASTTDGRGIWYQHHTNENIVHYVAALCNQALVDKIISDACEDAQITTQPLINGLRLRKNGRLTFAFNFGPSTVNLENSNNYLAGQKKLTVGEYAIYIDDN